MKWQQKPILILQFDDFCSFSSEELFVIGDIFI